MRLSYLLGPELKQVLREDPEQVRMLLDEIHPEDLADIVAELEAEEAATLMARLPAETAAPIFERLEEHEQEEIAALMAPESVAHIASEMDADDRADFISLLDEEHGDEVRRNLERVDPEAAEEVREIEKWPETSAGHLVTTRYASVDPRATLGEAILAARTLLLEDSEPIYNVYIVRDDERLEGVVPVGQLICHDDRGLAVSTLAMKNVISVPPHTDQEEVARQMAKYDLNEMPVIDDQGMLLGVITVDDIVDVLAQEQTEDVQKLGGIEPLDLPYFQTRFLEFIKKRGVWLVMLFFGEFFTQTALRHYDSVFEAIKGAAYYIPLLISAGGNSGSQSSTLVIRGMAVGEIRMADWWRILLRELGMGLVLGLILGGIGFVRVLMYPDQGVDFALTIAISLVGIVVGGCTVGAMLPMLLRRLGLDPATSSTPFVASLVDVLGIIIFVYCAHAVMGVLFQGNVVMP